MATGLAEVLLPCEAAVFDSAVEFFTGKLAFRVLRIWPADSPSVAVCHGYGIRIRLRKEEEIAKSEKKKSAPDLIILVPPTQLPSPATLVAPNGSQIEFQSNQPPLNLPRPKEVKQPIVTRPKSDQAGVKGRAGMIYHDLLPGQLGGYLVASRICIPTAGKVPDYEHFHNVAFQMIYCLRGWVKVVYEDQGPEFKMTKGDCVLQPSTIRHRVLESSAGLEVLELGAPAQHMTSADPDAKLPDSTEPNPVRVYGRGQSFVRHQSKLAEWTMLDKQHSGSESGGSAFEQRDVGIENATNGAVDVTVVRCKAEEKQKSDDAAESSATSRCRESGKMCHKDRLAFVYVSEGNITVLVYSNAEGGLDVHRLQEGDSLLLPMASSHAFKASDEKYCELIRVLLPEDFSKFDHAGDDTKKSEALAKQQAELKSETK